MERDLICINCPMGCNLHVVMEKGEVVSVTGNTCPPRQGVCHYGSDPSGADGDQYCTGQRWQYRHGFMQDQPAGR